MRAALRGLAANVAAGLRLALLRPVDRAAFRVDAAQLLLLAVLSALIDVGTDWLRYGPDAAFSAAAAGGELASFALLVLMAAMIAWILRDAALVAALPVVVLAGMPLVQVAAVVPFLAALDEERSPWVTDAAYLLVVTWFVLVLARSAYVTLQPRPRRGLLAAAAAALLAAPLMAPPGVLPEASWWEPVGDDVLADTANPAAEPVLALQRELQDEALAALEEHVPGEVDLYFVAFAPDGDGARWGPRVEAARKAMDDHWRTHGRSLVYLNDRARLGEIPMATVSHLREALEEIAAIAEPDEDVVMLYLAGRGNADASMTVELPPLGLVQLSATGLASLVEQAGFRWRVVVVETCDPAPFVEALADARTLVMAAAADCAASAGAATAFGDVLFGEALPSAATLPGAFEAARTRLAARGKAPVMRLGDEIAAHLGRLRGVGGTRATAAGPRRG